MITKTLICDYCGNQFLRTGYPSQFTKYKANYCHKRCAMLAARELYRPTQITVLSNNGHIMVRVKTHPNANKNSQVPKAHLVMENHIGRYIKKTEVVHHIDLNPLNNNNANLQIMTISEHVKLHNSLRQRRGNGTFNKALPKMRNATCPD